MDDLRISDLSEAQRKEYLALLERMEKAAPVLMPIYDENGNVTAGYLGEKRSKNAE